MKQLSRVTSAAGRVLGQLGFALADGFALLTLHILQKTVLLPQVLAQ